MERWMTDLRDEWIRRLSILEMSEEVKGRGLLGRRYWLVVGLTG